MSVKRGLGRGLGALLGDGAAIAAANAANAATHATPNRSGLTQIPVESIVPNPRQPRTTFDAGALGELSASITEFGVLVPILVRKLDGERFELIAGERRWRATVAAGLTMIPAIVRTADDRESLEVAIIENLQRENLDALEEAMGFAHLMETYAFTQERVAERVGRSRPAIANALRLLALSDAIKSLVRGGQLSAGAARALLAIPPDRRDAVAQRVVAEGLSVRAIEALGRDPVVKPRRDVPPIDAETAAVVDRLRFRFATQVGLVRRERGGSIEIRFADDGDLIRIVDLLLGESV